MDRRSLPPVSALMIHPLRGGTGLERPGMATKTTEKNEGDVAEAPQVDSPLLDLTDQAVKRMIKLAKKRGYVTYDELNEVLPSDQTPRTRSRTSTRCSTRWASTWSESRRPTPSGEEPGAAPTRPTTRTSRGDLVEAAPRAVVARAEKAEPTDRTDDPVRMYLREMGSVELLSREGEIAIAKRIEAGREAMIAGLCESPLTFQAIIIWRDELNEGKVLLRDIIDLEATYAGPEGKGGPKVEGEEGEAVRRRRRAAAEARAEGEEPPIPEGDLEEDDMENNVSLSAMEAELKPKVLETFDRIADAYKKLRRLQDQNVESKLQNTTLSPAQERKYKKLKEEIVADVKSLSLNQNRIDALVEQLYDINKRLIGLEGRLMRLAESYRVSREDFLKNYQGSELDPKWLLRVSKLGTRGWKDFVAHDKDTIKDIRQEIHNARLRDGPGDPGVPQDRPHGAEGRARGPAGQEGDGRGQPAPRDLHRQEVHEPRPAVPGPDPGGQHRPDEGGRQVRVPPRLQVLDLRHLVDPAGDHPLDRRPGPHHPHPGAHDRDDQQDRPHLAPDAARDRPRADAGGTGREAGHAAGEGAQGPEDRQGADLARDADRRRGGFASRRLHRGQERHPADRRGDPVATCARRRRACWPRSRRARSACCACASASA